jgi:hypothetical protein
MVEDLLYAGSVLSVNSEDFLDKFYLEGVKSGRKPDGLFHFCNDLLASLTSERSNSLNHLKEQNPQSPDINLIVVVFFLDHLWRHILKGATHGSSGLKNSSKSKITQFSRVVLGNENIFRLEISQKVP